MSPAVGFCFYSEIVVLILWKVAECRICVTREQAHTRKLTASCSKFVDESFAVSLFMIQASLSCKRCDVG